MFYIRFYSSVNNKIPVSRSYYYVIQSRRWASFNVNIRIWISILLQLLLVSKLIALVQNMARYLKQFLIVENTKNKWVSILIKADSSICSCPVLNTFSYRPNTNTLPHFCCLSVILKQINYNSNNLRFCSNARMRANIPTYRFLLTHIKACAHG